MHKTYIYIYLKPPTKLATIIDKMGCMCLFRQFRMKYVFAFYSLIQNLCCTRPSFDENEIEKKPIGVAINKTNIHTAYYWHY